MPEYLFEIEDWLDHLINGIKNLIHTYEPRLFEIDSFSKEYSENARLIVINLEKFRNPDVVRDLKVKLRASCLIPDRSQQLNNYVSKLRKKFGDFWWVGSEFEDFYSSVMTKDKVLNERLYEIRSFFKHETWDTDPYNFDPTISSILSEYYIDDQARTTSHEEDESSALNIQAPTLTTSGIKLKWNGTNDSLYDLIAQLSLITTKDNKPLLDNTIEGLATFLANYVEDMPSIGTIERRIRVFRDPQGQQPKRGRIELHINKGSQ